MTRDERIAKIRGGCWIRYSRAEEITARLDRLLQLPTTHRMPNLLIVGETNNGKTALVNHFLAQHRAQLGASGTPSCIPIVAVQAPPLPDERRFYQAILAQVFAPFRPSKTAGNLQFEVVQLLSTVGVKMLIVDEIQHVLAGPMLRQRHFLNVIKYLGNELQIPIVAAGTHDAFNAIQTDPQLSNRFEPALLRRWTMTDEYLRLLASFEVALPLERHSRLAELPLARKILGLCEGTIGEIAALLTGAALVAIERGTEQITSSVLDDCGYIAPRERRRSSAPAPI
jgi:Bacterial TniB protein